MNSAEREDVGPPPRHGEQAVAEVYAKANVEERPFVSNKPVIGTLIVAIRSVWNSVSTKWFVRAIRQQQNEFNFAAAGFMEKLDQDVRRLGQMIGNLDSRVYEGDRDSNVLVRDLVELSLRLEATRQRLDEQAASLDERVTKLEQALEEAGDHEEDKG